MLRRRRKSGNPEAVRYIAGTMYGKASYMHECERFTADLEEIKTKIQNEIDYQAVDAFVDNVKQIREKEHDYLVTEVWEPIGSPGIVEWIIVTVGAIIVGILGGWIPAAIVVIAWTVMQIIEFLTPRHCCKYCGACFATVAELEAHVKTAHPGEPHYLCPYCGMGFFTEEEKLAHMVECPLRPWTVRLSEWLPWIVAGIFGLAAIVVIPRVWRR